jgi:hypothetical protein
MKLHLLDLEKEAEISSKEGVTISQTKRCYIQKTWICSKHRFQNLKHQNTVHKLVKVCVC